VAARKAGFEVNEPTVEVKYVSNQEDLKKCFEFGQQIAAKIKA
jgi:flavorubredoxin